MNRRETRAAGTTLIGLDGVGWDLVDDLVENADVPTLAGLVDESVHGVTRSTIPSLTCPALPTLYTGLNPGNLGIFDFVKPDGDIVDYDDVVEPAIWDYLTTADTSMVVGAMRTTHPAPDVDGVFISDVLSTSEEPDFVTPASAREYGERFHRLRDRLETLKKDGDEDALLETFVEMNDERTEVFLDLLEREEPEFALLWFGLSDGVQHWFWDDRPRLYEFFETLDDRLAEVLAAREDTNVLLVGDHGFGPAVRYRFHLNEALRRGGYLETTGGPVRRKLTELSYLLSERYVSDRWKRVALEAVNRVRDGDRGDDGDDPTDGADDGDRTVVSPMDNLPGIDWSRTRAHASTRKGWGIDLVPGNVEDADALRREIVEYLESIEAPDGTPAVKGAWPGEEVYWGKYGDQVPDVVYLAHDELKTRPSLVGSLFSEIPGDNNPSHESSREAVFMATGPDVDDAADDVGTVDLYDLAPTTMALLGRPVPGHFDGSVRTELLAADGDDVRTGATDPVERYRIRKGLKAVTTGSAAGRL